MAQYIDGAFQLFGMDASIYSDLYKSAYGFRPRGETIFYSLEALDKHFSDLQNIIEEEYQHDKERAEAGWISLMEEIDRCIFNGAKTKRDAFRWIMDANDLEINSDNVDYLFYISGINTEVSKYTKKLKDLIGNF